MTDRDETSSVLPFPRPGASPRPRQRTRQGTRSRTRSRGTGPSLQGVAERWESSALPFTSLLARLTPYIESRAARLARRDRELDQDLRQEGRISLWRLDPVRIAAAICPDAYCRATIRHAMTRYLRWTGRQLPGDHPVTWDVVDFVLDAYRRRAA